MRYKYIARQQSSVVANGNIRTRENESKEQIEGWLNKMDAKGWELVGMVQRVSTERPFWIFKKPTRSRKGAGFGRKHFDNGARDRRRY